MWNFVFSSVDQKSNVIFAFDKWSETWKFMPIECNWIKTEIKLWIYILEQVAGHTEVHPINLL